MLVRLNRGSTFADPVAGEHRIEFAQRRFDSGEELAGNLVAAQLLGDRGQRALEMILDRQHVSRESRSGIARRLVLLGLKAAPDVLRFGGRVKRLGFRFLELPFELGDAIMLRDFGSTLGRLLTDLFRLFVQFFFVLRGVCHAINLVSALAVKSTMGTTRA